MASSSRLPRNILLIFTGCASILFAGCPKTGSTITPSSGPASAATQPLKLLVVDDPPLGEAVHREWKGRTEEELTVVNVGLAELSAASRLPGDAVIFPSGLVGQLAERGLISPLDASALEEPDFNHRDVFDQIRLREMKWGNRTVAAPLGSPQLGSTDV